MNNDIHIASRGAFAKRPLRPKHPRTYSQSNTWIHSGEFAREEVRNCPLLYSLGYRIRTKLPIWTELPSVDIAVMR